MSRLRADAFDLFVVAWIVGVFAFTAGVKAYPVICDPALPVCTGTRDPTLDQLVDFLAADNTDAHEYIKGVYVCTDFSRDLILSTSRQGWRAGYVLVSFSERESRHAMVAFVTSDGKLYYVEPQSDAIFPADVLKPGAAFMGGTVRQITVFWCGGDGA